ncbi:MAG: glutathione S-transferase family protein [Ferrovibrio sp.]|uniref:glutathione S-transferase family protein n=1 Tax=Ferrovibrio sp. TaxID=1917215 RepID=UPI0026181EE1|nr:glutathione S-transferase family protein [Ferrovibrio sp.]MCW0234641.1 glutathione S-transferase family protein [Ferrovibrio sp.]
MLKIWGRASSVNVQKVLWAADELGLTYERIDVGGKFGGTETAAYRAMNPNGLIPVLQDSDGSLHWESNSVVRYLAARYDAAGAGLWLADPAARSQADRWMDWASSLLGEPMRVLFWGLVRDPVKADLNAMTRAEDQAADYWARLDAHLATRPFVAGDRLTMGDIPAACQLQRWLLFPITRPALPHLAAWHDRLSQRPGYAKHIMVPMT